MLIKYILLYLIVNSCYDGLFGARCNSMKTCATCAVKKSWLGGHCRWCPRTLTCHAQGSIFYNKCSRTENIVSVSKCETTIPVFNETEAWLMLQLSAAAYSDNPKNCFSAISNNDFELYETAEYECPLSTKCFAFTAYSHLHKAIVVSYRGSEDASQVFAQVVQNLFTFKKDIEDGSVYPYYYDAYNAFKPCILKGIQELLVLYKDYTVYFTGHSLGGAVASITSTMLTKLGYLRNDKVKLITFGQPRVGTYNAATTHDTNVPYSFRITHAADPIVHYPPCFHVPFPPPSLLSYCVGVGVLKFPYHHGKEVFYPNSMKVGANLFRVCNGHPFNEDILCADGVIMPIDIDDHKIYYNVHVSKYGKSGCGSVQPPRRKREASFAEEKFDIELNNTFDENEHLPTHKVTLICRKFNTGRVEATQHTADFDGNDDHSDHSKRTVNWIGIFFGALLFTIFILLGIVFYRRKKNQGRIGYESLTFEL